MSYYASDPAQLDHIIQALATQCANAPAHTRWHALVDLAFDEGRQRMPLKTSPTALYRHGRLAPMQAVSPVLCELPMDRPDELVSIVRTLNRHAAGRPMLSFLASKLPEPQLADAMQPVLEVQTSDGQPFLLRFADTRVLVTLPASLTTAHWVKVCAPLVGWLAIDRFGELVELPMPIPSAPAMERLARMQVDDAELGALLRAGEADALIAALADGFPDLLPKQARAALYQEVGHVCALARTHGINGSGDQLALALANRMMGGGLWRDAKLDQWLARRAGQPGQFADALEEFVETLA